VKARKKGSMALWSRLLSAFRGPGPPSSVDITMHLSRLNSLVLAYQDVENLASELEMDALLEQELRWFRQHRLKLTIKDGQHVLDT
jgi:hypothetical protein